MKYLAILILFASCQSPAIITKQQATCVYNDGTIARFEYKRTEHLNRIVTTYQARAGRYEVGQKYIIKIISK